MAIVTIPQDCLEAESARSPGWCRQLERGDILYFPQSPIAIPKEDISFLLGQQQSDSSLHKNIAYKPGPDALSGVDTKSADAAAVERLHQIMRSYSNAVTHFLRGFLAPYLGQWRLDYASFRPQEEEGRDLATRKRNDLLHTDAFPTRPTHGARILRFFNNIHPERTRDWVVGEPLPEFISEYVPERIAPRPDAGGLRAAKSLGRALGLGAMLPQLKRSPYDDFMMRFHNYLKENQAFQRDSPKHAFDFPPGSSWMVYTDMLPHAVLRGQYALEQTVLVEHGAMLTPEYAPLTALEAISGQRLV